MLLCETAASELRLRARDAGVVAFCAISPAALFPEWLPGIGELPVRRVVPRELLVAATLAGERQAPAPQGDKALRPLSRSLIDGGAPYAWRPVRRSIASTAPDPAAAITAILAATQRGPFFVHGNDVGKDATATGR